VGEGFLSYDDLSVIEPEDLMEMGELSAEAVDAIVAEAEHRANLAEEAAADERRKQREQERIDQATAEAEAAEAALAGTAAAGDAGTGEQEQETGSEDEPSTADEAAEGDVETSVPPSAGS
jgi:N utilization substance protein A